VAAQFQVGPDVVVTLEYDVFDAEGEPVGGSGGPREVLFGVGDLLPAVEQRLEGLEPGGACSVQLKPEDAFGKRDPKAWVEVDREEFPDDVAPGDQFEAEGADGEAVLLKVLDVAEDHVVIDQNHPLAGQSLRVEVRVLGTRLALAEEREAAAARLAQAPSGAESPLIPAGRLLRGPSRR
jgi:FKBP-type peptidyl-prolyl cis-trans isomerase SlyD